MEILVTLTIISVPVIYIYGIDIFEYTHSPTSASKTFSVLPNGKVLNGASRFF